MVCFTDLPEDLINEIFKQCTETNTKEGEGTRTFIKFKYHHDRVEYFEYIGDMSMGNPNGYGTMRRIENNSINIEIPPGKNIETDWLYLPFLLVFKNHKPKVKYN